MDEIEKDPEIAAAMGFSNFGGNGNKRRKFNHLDDAFTGAGTAKSKGGAPNSQTGANSVELGVRQKPANVDVGPREMEPEERKADGGEAGLTTDDDDAPGGVGVDVEAQEPKAQEKEKGKAKQKQKQKQSAPVGLAGFLARGKALKDPPPTANPNESGNGPNPSFQANNSATPEKVETGPSASRITSAVGEVPKYENLTQEDLYRWRRGVRNEHGDIAYYSPSFVEDPWKD
ncbi:hypothetical protein K402DRAFT_422885 [Aulographum hederae CBS 113979]|uniref:Uncharacterized protein n=1 Tax=Aulographum hederae CBS 113979 TaxID=1176131 RepID=A0A6G1GTT0_9PEZI|nr:hypothetical protein K402DRAFT_422885 [Aulographum hederae CBS 113979]